jgi:hypothetical protein
MATVFPTVLERPAQSYLAQWVGMTTGDVGDRIDYVGHADRTVQVVGTFGGATVTLQGSLDGANWATLNDAQGQPIEITAARIEAVTEMVLFIRPIVTGGSGANVTVLLMMRKTG